MVYLFNFRVKVKKNVLIHYAPYKYREELGWKLKEV